MSDKVVSLEEWLRERRALQEQHWHTMINEALKDLVEFGFVCLTDVQLAEDVWQWTWDWPELYVLHGSGEVWVVERAIGDQMVGGE